MGQDSNNASAAQSLPHTDGSLPRFKVEEMGGNAVLFWENEEWTGKQEYIYGIPERHAEWMEGIAKELNKRVDLLDDGAELAGLDHVADFAQ